MLDKTSLTGTNSLLSLLPKKLNTLITEQCDTIQMNFGDVLCVAGQKLQQVYFPLSGFISLVAHPDQNKLLEMGMIGSEGMLGSTLVLGIRQAPLNAMVQGSGKTLVLSANDFYKLMLEYSALHTLLGRYVYVLLLQLAQNNYCNAVHEVSHRLARWLLMAHDRAHLQSFHLTHQFIANMLGVRRSAISLAAGQFQKKGLIHYSRGTIKVVSRQGLEAESCQCYFTDRQDFSQFLTVK
ncbi:Crp/Fnr family transcriptional regulator [Neptunicella sp.]|uniref:Crp/Fnr family transcriptional regulator n=1 Tax=Neptunicella sp. TaxID=2125986 RepID=UPI003F690AD9